MSTVQEGNASVSNWVEEHLLQMQNSRLCAALLPHTFRHNYQPTLPQCSAGAVVVTALSFAISLGLKPGGCMRGACSGHPAHHPDRRAAVTAGRPAHRLALPFLLACAGTDAAIEMQKRDSKKFNK